MKKLFLILALCMLSFVVSAGGQQEEATGSEAEVKEPTEIIYYMWDDPTYKQIIEAYNASQDEVKVKMNIVPAADYEVKLLTILAGGVEVDAYMQKRQTDMFAQYANGYIEPLDDLIETHNYDIDGVSAYSSAITVDGKTLAIPFRGASWYVYYNKNLFDQANLPYPTEYVESGEWTWDKYAELAGKLSTHDGEAYGGLFYTWGGCQVVPALQAGHDFITTDGEIDLGPAVLKSFQLRRELEEDRSIIPLFELKATKTHYSTAFFGGNVGMLVIGEWFPGQLMNAREEGKFQGFTWKDWGVTRLPCDFEDYRTFGNPTFNHIHADSDKKDAAFKFVSWMGGPEGAVEVARAGFLPSRINDGVKESLREAVPDEESFRYFSEGPKVMPQFYTKYGTRVEQTVNEMMELYLQEDFSSDSAFMNEFEKKLEEVVETTD